VHHYVYGTKSNVPEYLLDYSADRSNPTAYRILSDHLGSPRLVVDAAAPSIVVHKLRHDEFGRVEQDQVTPAGLTAGYRRIPFGFAGGLYDPRTKLVRFGARDYDPRIGRWTSKDGLLVFGGSNFYVYSSNDPVNTRDPTGRHPASLFRAGLVTCGIPSGRFQSLST
jgi:RHS repeat-associated protein